MHVTTPESTGRGEHLPFLAHHFDTPQQQFAAFEQVLEESLQHYGVQVQWNHALSQLVSHDDRVTVTVDELVKESVGYAVAHSEWLVAKTTELEVPFVIGADGHRSRVRRELRIDFPEVGPQQHFAVFEFQTDADLKDQLHLVVANGTSNVVWPLPGGFCRWSFELPEFTAALEARQKARVAVQLGGAEYPVLEESQLRKLLAERAPWFPGSVGQINWRMIVRFERRLASAFGRQRVWLAGDSGHVTGPAGVQSMNVGLREAQDLVAILTGILRDRQPLAQLDQYNRDRLTEWRALLGLEGGLHATDAPDPWLREHLARVLPCLPASGPDLVALGQQLGCQE
jgi:2-polyprenyl-6-methoxyphenol hydroxylase-like FAD-dependent oxidoreductase